MSNMKQIAQAARVSLGTVSNVLNNSAVVREPLRRRVLETVEALGYQPSQLARGLRKVKTNMIGMIIPDITNPFFPALVRGAEDMAFSNGYRLILCNTDNDHTKELSHLKELRTYLPSGLIVIPSSFSDLTKEAESYRRSGTAVVCVDRLPRHWKGDTVTVDNEQGAYAATCYLLTMGHTRIATISGPLHLTNARDRVIGFRRALQEARIPIRAEYVLESTFDKQGGFTQTALLLRQSPRPTAILAGNDMIALGAILAVREAGLNCPRDISLIGFDNLELAEITDPPLTSVAQPEYQMGTAAAQIVLNRMGGDSKPAQHCILGTKLAIRQSVAPCSAGNHTERPKPRTKTPRANTLKSRA